jgi:Mg-chelatase subunit ChlD
MGFAVAPGGVTKLKAARRAARLFVQRLDLTRDQAAVVAFDDEARVLAPLGSGDAALGVALDRLATREGTRIDAGLRAAWTALSGPRRRPSNTAAVLLITDGQPTRSTESDVLDAARALHARGVATFVVGLGGDVNPRLLRRAADRPERYFDTPLAAGLGRDLDAVYAQIARVEPCPPTRFWGGR